MKFGRARFAGDGSITYPHRGWEPPPPIPGYIRDPGNKWRFIPKWPDCQFRVRTVGTKPCGAVDVVMMCQCAECPLFKKRALFRDCETCEHKKPAG